MKIFRLILTIVFMLTFAVDVANRCAGESSVATQVCACTVYNRLQAGWMPSTVLRHYYAADRPATPSQVATVSSVLSGETTCGAEYYLWSSSDLAGIGLDVDDAVVTVCSDGRCVYGFGKGALQ